jgi:hypothetical protein
MKVYFPLINSIFGKATRCLKVARLRQVLNGMMMKTDMQNCRMVLCHSEKSLSQCLSVHYKPQCRLDENKMGVTAVRRLQGT